MGISYFASTSVALIGLFGSVSDISNLFAFTIVHNRYLLFHTFQKYVGLSTFIAHTGSMAFLFALLQIVRYFRGLEVASTNLEGQVLKPMFFPANTSHLRLFPKKHGFSYSYLLTGVPVGWTGSSGGMISVDEKNNVSPWYKRLLYFQPMSPWYVVDGDAYLDRGHVPGGLEGKLKRFLHDQGLNHEDYPYAYLMTSSRFLGYQNNPVSIWNLYSRNKELKAVILEVNNTFDERHTYFVTSKDVEASMIEKTKGKPPRFTNTWSKEFYVSPFNSRSGSYSISASDPFFPSLSGSNNLDLTLTLTSTERAFLVARIFSDGPALDPSTMSVLQKTQFILSWWWVGFATFPRTLVQASILFFKRSLPWVSRPEPLKVTLSRHADATQKTLEVLFRQYLQHLIETADQPLILKYRPAGLLDNKVEMMYSPSAQMSPQLAEPIEISVFTPIFYTQFVKYIDSIQALEMESKNEIISISNADLLWALPTQLGLQPGMRPEDYGSSDINTFSSMFFRIIYSTRILPRLESSGSVFSIFDKYILKETDHATPSLYQRMLFKMWLSDWVAFGWIDLLEFQWWLIKSGVSWWVAGKLCLVKE
ncbi:hypothetical protein sscle_08g062100 [Sclerotinia sclerotiorum 1980 UF-70]|uniref:Uncharacterized protein n=1 Tax=Sclerotinia sclerotiorum (strain ATCC 18683 / 1980 / Ss-1) TaxID=665079 RepID=A0A1D9Q913_SCLS1|nr:hypothetical protein sscle_08g062100 [Sclerotinia sclerotiorum 1980 UF-70]